jgi:UPF0755 protein
MRRLLQLLALLVFLAAVGAVAIVWWSNKWLQQPLAGLQERTTFEVPRGVSMRSVAADLHARGLLDQPQVWVVWSRLMRRDSALKAGEYALQPGLTPRGLLSLLSSGQVLLHSITFIEGSTFADVRNALVANDAVRNDNGSRSDADIMRALGEPQLHPEGQFFPDTYRFPRGTTDLELLTIAHRRLQDELRKAWEHRAPALPFASPYEALTLASIVEKETALERERAQIAGVFVERLRRGMRLQTDPTVIYGMGVAYDGNIRRTDLSRDTPYNTYTRPGLPPTPIALPGLASLQAAVQPDVSGALFFVATGAGDGSHFFSKTLAEHNSAVKRYLRELRRR